MERHVLFAGILLILLSLIHFIFPRYFHWKRELHSLSLINRQLMYIHAFFIALIVFLMGILCLTSSQELIQSSFGKKISLGLSFFWACRLAIQFFGYSSKTWRGKKFETTIHILFTGFWIYLSTLFFLIYSR
jgi:hypothetical protein